MWMNARLMTQHESVMKMYRITAEMQYESMAMHKEFYVESGQTLVIRDRGRVIGATIGEPLWNEDKGVLSTGVDVSRYLNIHELSRGHWLKVAEAGKMPGPEDPDADKVFLNAYGSIMPEYSGCRLFSEISRFSEILAYEDGFDYMFSENSMPGTQRTYANFPGYEVVM
jgi:hypothetical protein